MTSWKISSRMCNITGGGITALQQSVAALKSDTETLKADTNTLKSMGAVKSVQQGSLEYYTPTKGWKNIVSLSPINSSKAMLIIAGSIGACKVRLTDTAIQADSDGETAYMDMSWQVVEFY